MPCRGRTCRSGTFFSAASISSFGRKARMKSSGGRPSSTWPRLDVRRLGDRRLVERVCDRPAHVHILERAVLDVDREAAPAAGVERPELHVRRLTQSGMSLRGTGERPVDLAALEREQTCVRVRDQREDDPVPGKLRAPPERVPLEHDARVRCVLDPACTAPCRRAARSACRTTRPSLRSRPSSRRAPGSRPA